MPKLPVLVWIKETVLGVESHLGMLLRCVCVTVAEPPRRRERRLYPACSLRAVPEPLAERRAYALDHLTHTHAMKPENR